MLVVKTCGVVMVVVVSVVTVQDEACKLRQQNGFSYLLVMARGACSSAVQMSRLEPPDVRLSTS